MKRLSLIGLAVLSACSNDGRWHSQRPGEEVGSSQKVVFDFQTGFKQTPVQLTVDGQQVLSEVLTTDQRVGLARSIKLPVRGASQLAAVIIVDRDARYSYEIQLGQGRYIGISKNLDTGKLQMEQRQQTFEYD